MAIIEVDTATVSGLGLRLQAVAQALETTSDDDLTPMFYGHGHTAGALADVLSDWSEKRRKLVPALTAVGEAAVKVAERYAYDEAAIAAACVPQDPS